MQTEFQESLPDLFELMEILDTHNLLITESHDEHRRSTFFEFLKKQTVFLFDDSENSKVVIVNSLKSPVDIYDIYQNNQGKLIVFDTEKLYGRKTYMNVAEGGFCSNPDSGEKWPVRYEGKHDFIFEGHVVILCPLKKSELKKKAIFEYALRDMAII